MLRKPKGFDDVEIKEMSNVPTLPAGNYVCRIQGAQQMSDGFGGEKIKLSFDIDEGEHKGFYALKYQHECDNPIDGQPPHWKGNIMLRIPADAKANETEEEKTRRERTTQSFKRTLAAFEDSNEGFHFDWMNPKGERQFDGLLIGIKFQETPYEFGDKSGVWQKPKYFCNVERIRSGKEKVLAPASEGSNSNSEPVKYIPPKEETYKEIPDDELPF